jgi:hypothetical protein
VWKLFGAIGPPRSVAKISRHKTAISPAADRRVVTVAPPSFPKNIPPLHRTGSEAANASPWLHYANLVTPNLFNIRHEARVVARAATSATKRRASQWRVA